MTNDTLVSINVINEESKVLLNSSSVPILYYWNGEGKLIENIFSDNSFKAQYISSIKTYEEYKNRAVYYFYFKFNEETGDEEYYDNSIKICNYFSFSLCSFSGIIGPFLYIIGNEYKKSALQSGAKGV